MEFTSGLFQSAPRSRDRGDRIRWVTPIGSTRFNPRPGHATGATQNQHQFFRPPGVSIRAPVTRPGRRAAAQGLRVAARVSIRAPVTRPGRRRHRRSHERLQWVSIRAPVTRPGRLFDDHDQAIQATVSIRAPVTRPGRLEGTVRSGQGELFQSAPRSRDRGDPPITILRWIWSCFNPRPGHATGATNCIRAAAAGGSCFNPRPGHATGATQTGQTADEMSYGFNPRPGHATGATFVARVPVGRGTVSIRAPVTRPGRPPLRP